MSRVELIGSAYSGKSIIASGQETVNLYGEVNAASDPNAPTPVSYYPTAGTDLYAQPNPLNFNKVRGMYRTSIDTAYTVIGQTLYVIQNGIVIELGAIANKPSQVYFSDNGLVCVFVDGQNGYVIDLISNNYALITDPNFYGADYIALLDTFFIFNRPGTNQFFITGSNVDYGMLTNTSIGTGFISASGTNYTVGVYSGVALTGGSGTGATAEITISSGIIATIGLISGGTGYTNGVFKGVQLTGGSGSGAVADITVVGGIVTAVSLTQADDQFGINYAIGDNLSASTDDIGPGTGFSIQVDTIATGVSDVEIDDDGVNYIAGDTLSVNAANVGGTGAGFAYIVQTSGSAFDPLDIAAKSGFNDQISGIVAIHRELWLIGTLTTEIWIGTGAADFYFQEVQGTFVNHGCGAQYSIASQDVLCFFLQQDMQGNCLVLQGQGYDITEISTPRIVSEFRKYTTVADAIGFCFQIEDHSYYALVFPTANKGWLYDLSTSAKLGFPFWSEWNWLDVNGNLLRPRANCAIFYNGLNLVGDWENGNILELDINTNTDYTNDANNNITLSPIVRTKTFPHAVENNNKISYKGFMVDMELGTAKEGAPTPMIYLSWSDNKGRSYGNPVGQSMGKIGEYLTVPTWNRLGEARDRVFKVSWSDDVVTALNGAFLTDIMQSKN